MRVCDKIVYKILKGSTLLNKVLFFSKKSLTILFFIYNTQAK